MPRPVFEPVRTIEKDGCRTSKISLYNHSGTHMDAASHFLASGDTIDAVDLNVCIGKAYVVNVSHLGLGKRIRVEDLSDMAGKSGEGDRLLFYTGWERYYPEDAYYHDFPALSLELSRWLVEKKVSFIGIDTSSVAALDDWEELTAVHTILLSHGIILVEGLSNLDKLPFDRPFHLVCLPMKLWNLDGAPARVVAILE
jgi:kynurenine formamidase